MSIEKDEVVPSFVRVEVLRSGEMKRKLDERVERETKRYKMVLEGGGKEDRADVKRVIVDGRAREVIVLE